VYQTPIPKIGEANSTAGVSRAEKSAKSRR
jgi:hypothetical protein